MLTIQDAVNKIKILIENAIINGGVVEKNNLIRTQMPICLLHDATKASFINEGINPNFVAPAYGQHAGEKKLAGFFKYKDQDICFMPNNYNMHEEILNFNGILKGKKDSFGQQLTEHILSVNVRSQLSSTAKNFDTLYERTFAEALNLHLRCKKMVLGELYMIPVYEYDDILAKKNVVGFKNNRNISKHLEKYIYSFNAVNDRKTTHGEEYKYERVCLLIVDFNRPQSKIYNTNAELIADNLLSANTNAFIDNMNYTNFAKDLVKIYEQRFGTGRFI